MNFLKAEIERKRKQLQEKNVLGPEKKYFKRADLIEKEKEEYFRRHRPKAEDVKRLTELSEGTSKSNDGAGMIFVNFCWILTLFSKNSSNPRSNRILT